MWKINFYCWSNGFEDVWLINKYLILTKFGLSFIIFVVYYIIVRLRRLNRV